MCINATSLIASTLTPTTGWVSGQNQGVKKIFRPTKTHERTWISGD
jgi:hypothetical protein